MVKPNDALFVSIHYSDGTIEAVENNYFLTFRGDPDFEVHCSMKGDAIEGMGFLIQTMAELGRAADMLDCYIRDQIEKGRSFGLQVQG